MVHTDSPHCCRRNIKPGTHSYFYLYNFVNHRQTLLYLSTQTADQCTLQLKSVKHRGWKSIGYFDYVKDVYVLCCRVVYWSWHKIPKSPFQRVRRENIWAVLGFKPFLSPPAVDSHPWSHGPGQNHCKSPLCYIPGLHTGWALLHLWLAIIFAYGS